VGELPAQIGKYRVLKALGQGGMGVVYLGRDDSLGRNVAIKVINARLEGVENALRRFGREARAIARLSNPHIVHVYDFEPDGSPPFLAMEYVPGCGLDGIIHQGGPLGYPEILDGARQILAGMAAAHRAGIIHRDMKPANILCSLEGVYKLTDFGLARSMVASSGTLTASGTIIGSLRYLAPEIAAGEPATTFSDLYSVGITIYEMISGTTPFQDPSPLKLVHQIAAQAPAPVRELRADVPAELELWLSHLLEHEVDRRYASAEVALRALESMDFGPMPATSRYASVELPREAVDLSAPTAAPEAAAHAKTVDLGAATRDLAGPSAQPPSQPPPSQPPPARPAAAQPAEPAPVQTPVTQLTAATVGPQTQAISMAPDAAAKPRTLGGCLTAILGVVVLILTATPMLVSVTLFFSQGAPWIQWGEPDGTMLTYGPGLVQMRRANGKVYELTRVGFRATKPSGSERRVNLSGFWLIAPPALLLILGLALAAFMIHHGLRRPPPPPQHTQVIVQVNR